MELSTTRRLLSRAYAVCLSVCTALLIFTLIISGLFASSTFVEKIMISDALINACEAQLDAKYETLSAETGIHERVFQQVKTDYSTEEALTSALRNLNGEEDSSLYSNSLVNYFKKLCKEFLQGNKMKYDEKNVSLAAERAARIYSECVGLHQAELISGKADEAKRMSRNVSLASASLFAVIVLLLFVMYSEKNKAYSYTLSGVSGGALGLLLGALVSFIVKPWKAINITPAAFQEGVMKLFNYAFLLICLVSLAVCVAAFIGEILLHKSAHKK